MKRNKIILLIIFCLSYSLFILQVSMSIENVISITLDVWKNDTVIEKDISIVEGRVTEITVPGTDYAIKLLDKDDKLSVEKSFGIRFILFGEPPRILDDEIINIKLPYIESVNKVTLEHNNKIIFTKVISVCDNDNSCEDPENYLICTNDCPSGSRDNYCDKVLDGICDPDCAKEVDIDCTCGNNICDLKENTENCPKDCKPKNEMITLLLILLIVIALLLIFYRRFCIKKKKRPKKSFK